MHLLDGVPEHSEYCSWREGGPCTCNARVYMGPIHPPGCGWSRVASVASGTGVPPAWEDCTCEQRLKQAHYDGQRKVPKKMSTITEPTKFDGDKVRYDLIPVTVLHEVAEVFTGGAKKYDDYNYLGLSQWRLFGALLRHAFAWARGEDADEESGKSHLAHTVCCAMMLRHQETRSASENRIDSSDS